MRTKLAAVIGIGVLLVLSSPSLATAILSLNNANSSAHEVWIQPGQAFDVDINLDVNYQMYALNSVIQASASDVFSIFMRTDRWPWQGSGGFGTLAPDSAPLSWSMRFPQYFGPGTSCLATVGMAVASDAQPATYLLSLSDINVSPDRALPYFARGTPGEDFIVHVMPEPTTCLLCLVVGSLLSRKAR